MYYLWLDEMRSNYLSELLLWTVNLLFLAGFLLFLLIAGSGFLSPGVGHDDTVKICDLCEKKIPHQQGVYSAGAVHICHEEQFYQQATAYRGTSRKETDGLNARMEPRLPSDLQSHLERQDRLPQRPLAYGLSYNFGVATDRYSDYRPRNPAETYQPPFAYSRFKQEPSNPWERMAEPIRRIQREERSAKSWQKTKQQQLDFSRGYKRFL